MSVEHAYCSWLYLPFCLGHLCAALTPSWPAGSSSSPRSTARVFPGQGRRLHELWRQRLLSSVFMSWLNYPKPLYPAGKEPAYVNELSPFKPSIGSCLEMKVQASHIPRLAQSFLALNMMAPGEAVPLLDFSSPTFSASIHQPPMHTLPHVRFSAYLRKRMKSCLS